jgi:hypothetical protein
LDERLDFNQGKSQKLFIDRRSKQVLKERLDSNQESLRGFSSTKGASKVLDERLDSDQESLGNFSPTFLRKQIWGTNSLKRNVSNMKR